VRDVHPTHYGRICPIETPEGPNIGLISSLSCFARINDYGFIESPYRKVKGGRIIDYVHIVNAGDSEFKAGDIVERDKVEELNEELKRRKVVYEPYCFYLSAWEEDKYVIAQANVALDEKQRITTELVNSERIIVRVESDHSGGLSREVGADIYQLIKFKRSNQNTCINQKPLVRVGDRVRKGQVLADGPCTDRGELALGRNVLVAFLPWRGYNFEDAILVSEKLVKDDYYTSIHIEEYEIEARDTKLGP